MRNHDETSRGVRPFVLGLSWWLALGSVVAAQCPAPSWSGMNAVPGVYDVTSPTISTQITWDPDGAAGPLAPVVVAAGAFSVAGNTTANHVAAWDGTSWQALGSVPGVVVPSLGVYNDDLVAGSTSAVYRWNGSAWVALGAITGNPGTFATYNGDLITAGSAVRKWDGATWTTIGVPAGGPFSPIIIDLLVLGGDLYASGHFTSISGVPANGVARWNGVSWQALGGGLVGGQLGPTGLALAAYNGEVVVAGSFDSAGGVAVNSIARWNGTSWAALPGIMPVFPLNTRIQDLAVFNGELIAGGRMNLSGGGLPSGILRWNGSTWQTLGSGLDIPLASINNGPTVDTLTVCNGAVFAAGKFDLAGGIDAHRIARWNGTSWSSLGVGVSFAAKCFGSYGGELIVGGPFAGSFGAGANGIARWNGSSWAALGGGLSAPGIVSWASASAVTVHNGSLIAGGDFTLAGGSQAFHVARWDGSSWHPIGGGLLGTVNALAVYGGDLIAAGGFVTAGGGTGVNNIARWDGFQWLPLGTGVSGAVGALAVYGGELVAAGAFATAGGLTASGIARWNGTSWQPFGNGTMAGFATSLAIYGGNLIVGGSFSSVGGVSASGIAGWNGSAWYPLGNVSASTIGAFAVLQGELYASATSFAFPSGTAAGVARWNGSLWQPLGGGVEPPPPGINFFASFVTGLGVWQDSLFVGGYFGHADGIVTPYLARWSSPRPILALTQSGGPGTGVTVNNHWLVPGHEYYNLASLDPCAGGPGSGPYGGLCFTDPAVLINQLLAPIGAVPFHFVAGAPDAAFGPFLLPPGLSIEALSADVTGGVIGCISPVTAFMTQ